MLLWVMVLGFQNTCAVSEKWNVSRVIPRLNGWVCKTLRLSPLAVKHSVLAVLAVLVQLPLEWNTYLFFKFWFCKLCVENWWVESIVLLIFVLWRCFNRRWVRGCGVGQKFLFYVVSTGYFYVLFLWVIAVSDFLLWKFKKN